MINLIVIFQYIGDREKHYPVDFETFYEFLIIDVDRIWGSHEKRPKVIRLYGVKSYIDSKGNKRESSWVRYIAT